MLEDGSWEKPHRPRKRDEFIPIEEVHQEHFHPDFQAGSATPEEELIAGEEEAAELGVHDDTPDYRRYGDVAVGPDTDEDSYAWEEKESREYYEKQLRKAIARFVAQEQDDPEPPARRENVKSEGSSRGAHGKWGREPYRKHKKREETIRKQNGSLEA